MPRGPPTLLPTALFTKLYQQNPEHPRIRKHRACVQVINYYLLHSHSASTNHNLSLNRTPYQVKILCDSYNFNFLNHHTNYFYDAFAYDFSTLHELEEGSVTVKQKLVHLLQLHTRC